MKTHLGLATTIALLASSTTAFAIGAASAPSTPGVWAHMTKVDVTSTKQSISPISRYYDLYTPANYYSNYKNVGKSAPLVIVLHPGGLSNAQPQNLVAQDSVWTTAQQCPALQATGLLCTKDQVSVADQYGILVAMPNGVQGYDSQNSDTAVYSDANSTSGEHLWNDCTGTSPGYGFTTPYRTQKSAKFVTVDDVAFIRQMIANIKTQYSVDPKRIYVTGMSNGGGMALRLAREASDIIAAAAVNSAGEGAYVNGSTLSLQDQCQYAPTISNGVLVANKQPNPVPLFLMKGNADADAVYTGGTTSTGVVNWYLPYDTAVAPDATPGIFSGANPQNQIGVGSNGFLKTNPANMSLVSLIRLRYGLSSTPTSTTTYADNDHHDNTTYTNSSGQTVTDVSTVSCRVFGTAGSRSEVDDCIALDDGHIEPTYSVPEGIDDLLAGVGNQNQDIDTVAEEWKFFQRFAHP